MRVTNEEVIKAYQQTGSVWKAGKVVGLAGQTVHDKLRAIGYKLAGSEWTEEEIAELKDLVSKLTIAQIANRLGRPYNGVAMKISRLGIGERFGNNQKVKIPRTGQYTKANVARYVSEIDQQNIKVTTYARANGLDIEPLVHAIQRFDAEWYERYSEKNAVKPQTACPYCSKQFWPLSHKQIYCNRKCANSSRVDNSYFGGRRRETVGLAEGVCQLCGEKVAKGLSSHHIKGKENDPDNEYLIALCQGCHQIVTIVSGRRFAATTEAWEVLIQLVLMRKNGHNSDFLGVYTAVDIKQITTKNVHLYQDEE